MTLIDNLVPSMIPVKFFERPQGKLAYKYYQPSNKGAATVMFCHGYRTGMYGTKSTYLQELALDQDLGFLSLDYTGHGQSDGVFEKSGLAEWVQDIEDIVKHTEVSRLIVVGSSLGGWLACHLAISMPERIQSLIFIAPAVDFTERLIWNNLTDVQRQTFEIEGSLPEIDVPSCLISTAKPYLLYPSGRLCDILCPVHILHGNLDDQVPLQESQALAEAIGHKQVVLTPVEGGNHSLSSLQDLELLGKTVKSMVQL